jgi:hypothetical protein
VTFDNRKDFLTFSSPAKSRQIAAKGEEAPLTVIPAAVALQNIMLAPFSTEDRAHFLKCLPMIAKAPRPTPNLRLSY